MRTPIPVFIAALGIAANAPACGAQARPERGQLLDVVVHGQSLERNLLDIPADQRVAIYLPPGYATSGRRYPVLYVLHGIQDSREAWTKAWGDPHPGYATIPEVMDAGVRRGSIGEFIVVMPDADKSCHYTDSPVKGKWGSYIARDLVAYVDRTYRTIAEPRSRGILGHSMGGHGAIKLAMTHPGVFGSVYAMNPSLLGWGGDLSPENRELAAVSRLRTIADVEAASFYVQAVIGIGQCFSPDPTAPLLTQIPFATGSDGAVIPGPAYARWSAQLPVQMAPAHRGDLAALIGLRFDSAFEDEFTHIPIATRAFARVLDSMGVRHTFELYQGDHRNRLWGENGRVFTQALPWFSRLFGLETATTATARATVPVAPNASPAPSAPSAPTANADAQAKLWRASQTGDLRALDAALKAGADPNAMDVSLSRTGRRPLNYAAENNLAAAIRMLVKAGADVNRPNTSGFTPLHHAAEAGAADAAEALLAAGANHRAALPSGSTPLRVAQQRGKTSVIKVLEKLPPH